VGVEVDTSPVGVGVEVDTSPVGVGVEVDTSPVFFSKFSNFVNETVFQNAKTGYSKKSW
jgi:hypothetical protein